MPVIINVLNISLTCTRTFKCGDERVIVQVRVIGGREGHGRCRGDGEATGGFIRGEVDDIQLRSGEGKQVEGQQVEGQQVEEQQVEGQQVKTKQVKWQQV